MCAKNDFFHYNLKIVVEKMTKKNRSAVTIKFFHYLIKSKNVSLYI